MPRSGAKTREKIIDAAQDLVFRHGFAATSLDKIIEMAGITKGAFFYHFKNKADLGRAMIGRFAERDLAHFERTMARAEKLSADPRQQALIFVGLIMEEFESLPDPVPGCLFTSYLYEPDEYPEDVAEVAADTIGRWRDSFAAKLGQARDHAGGARHWSPEGLASMLLAVIEGGYVLAKAGRDASVLAEVLGEYRSYLSSLLSGGQASQPA